MKRLLLLCLCALPAVSQTTIQPDCTFQTTLTSATVSTNVGNMGSKCTWWQMAYFADGLSALSIELDGAPDNAGAPGSFSTLGSVLTGANPSTNAQNAYMVTNAYTPWLRVNATVFTPTGSTGSVNVTLNGFKTQPVTTSASGGSSGGASAVCNQITLITNATFSISTSGAAQVIPGSSGKKTYLCKRYLTSVGPQTLTWTSATAGSCGGTTATFDQQVNTISEALDDDGQIVVGTGLNVCLNPSVSQSAALTVAYVQQ